MSTKRRVRSTARHLARRLLCPAALGALVGCGAEPPPPAAGRPFQVQVTHRSDAFGAPTFAWLTGSPELSPPADATPQSAAWQVLRRYAESQRLPQAAVQATALRAVHDTGRGAIIAHFEQRIDGLEVFHSGLNLALDRQLQPVAATGTLAASVVPHDRDFGQRPDRAIAAALGRMTARPPAVMNAQTPLVAAGPRDSAGYTSYTLGDASARVRPVYYPLPGGPVPAYYIELEVADEGAEAKETRLRAYVVSPDGQLLFDTDLTAADRYSYRVWADKDGRYTPWDGIHGNAYTPHPTGMRDGKAPSPVPTNLVTLQNAPFSKNDPWLPAGATQTKGNNVWAYADVAAPDGFGAGDIDVPVTAPGAFDRTYDPKTAPKSSVEASRAITTNLFYILNYMHDAFYDAGWDEKSGNPQEDNYGRGGVGADPIKGEAQDSSGVNNANASTPADGRSPRIQMYLWRTSARRVSVKSPMDIAGDLTASAASFGPTTFDLAGDTALAVDAVGTTSDACEALTNGAALMGKVALVDNGGCTAPVKVLNAQAAGAIGVIVVHNLATGTPSLTGTPAMPVTIPTLGVSQTDGAKIKAKLAAGTAVNVNVFSATYETDGSLDQGIVSHEWGHVLSNRLIGNASGLSNIQGRGMGEGWSDFVALLTLTRPEDAMVASNRDWTGVYSMGGASLYSQYSFYDGIRRYPYSTDKSKNPLTFKHIQGGVALPAMPTPRFGADGANNMEVHNTGEVWAAMLWECYVNLLRQHPFDTARTRMHDYLVGGMKLTPNAPTIMEARDALLAAIFASDKDDGLRCWEGFARRGAGVGATGPLRSAADNKPVVESFSMGNDLQFVSAALDDTVKTCDADQTLDSGEIGWLAVKIRNSGAGALTSASVTVKADNPGVSFPEGDTVSVPKTLPWDYGTAKIKVALKDVTAITKINLTLEIRDPSLAVPRTVTGAATVVVNADWQPEASATDTVDAPSSLWSAAGDAKLDQSKVWSRQFDGFNGRWHIDASASPTDQYLVSPKLRAAMGTALKVDIKHRYRFEAQQGAFQDGGVLELSTDGMTWKDVGDKLTANGYRAALVKENPVLSERRAFAGSSTGYPAYLTSTLDLGMDYQGQEVQLRFRVGTDEGTGSEGWDVDELAFTGLTNQPFPRQVPHRGLCINHAPVANAGPEQTVASEAQVTLAGSGTDEDGDPLTYRWTQVEGPMVQLSDAGAAAPSFRAPLVPPEGSATAVVLALVVNDGKADSAASTVRISVDPAKKLVIEGGGCSCQVGGPQGSRGVPGGAGGAGALALLGALGLLRARRRSA